MRASMQSIPEIPTMPDLRIRKLRAAFYLEEMRETISALGFDVAVSSGGELELREAREPDFVLIVDGCADVSVINLGTLSACGVADISIMWEVDDNNMAKFAPGHSFRDDGKLLKPPGHKPPDFGAVLRQQGWAGERGC
jgi:predicted HAD superfamily Cof-like phosphohydrolase